MEGRDRWCCGEGVFFPKPLLALFLQNVFSYLPTLMIRIFFIYQHAGEDVHLCTRQLRTSARGSNQYTVLILGYLGHQLLNCIKEAKMMLSESRNLLLVWKMEVT